MKSAWDICFKMFLEEFLTVFSDYQGYLCPHLILDKVVILVRFAFLMHDRL